MIISCGEALIDMLPRQTVADEDAFMPVAGGAALNTAIALGRLGVPVGLFSGLSGDLFGQVLDAAMQASDVSSDLAIRSARPTTLAFVQITDGQAAYAFYDENTAGRMITPADLPDIPAAVSAMLFGGISLIAEPCGSAYEALMTREAQNRMTMIDPNIRTGFIADEPAYRARLGRMLALADIVKMSDEDLQWLFGEGDIAGLAGQVLAGGPSVVFVTEGARGATAFSRDETVFVNAPAVDVVDTVGAGDTFNAGVLAALHEGKCLSKSTLADIGPDMLKKAVELGTSAAAITVSRAGANPPWRQEI